jgi:hypothetical protein
MIYGVEMDSDGKIYITSFIKTNRGVQSIFRFP